MARKLIVGLFICCCLMSSFCFAASPAVRIKDIAHVLEARDNPIMGFGIVVGLRNTGDSAKTEFTMQALTNMLSRMGIAPQENEFKSRNVAAVIVTAKLPPFLKPGQNIDVTISSVGDATSIKGGTLLLTPLHGADDKVYAVAQGAVVVGDIGVEGIHSSAFVRRPATVGRIVNGGIVEEEVPVTVPQDYVAIVLDSPDFTTASRTASSLNKSGISAEAKDAAMIYVKRSPILVAETSFVTSIEIEVVTIEGEGGSFLVTREVLITKEVELVKEISETPVEFISRIENVKVVPDNIAKIVINERNGIIVLGENVRIAPVAVAYGGISVAISNMTTYSRSSGGDQGIAQADAYTEFTPKIREEGADTGVVAMEGGATLQDLVQALRAIGASPKDLIEILQAIKAAGALSAEIEII